MKKKSFILLAVILATLLSCENEKKPTEENLKKDGKVEKNESVFPLVKKLSEYEKTDFIPTPEHKISDKSNSVYCVTLLYAWDEIRKLINKPLEVSKENQDLFLLNNSTAFADVLKSNEYKTSIEVRDFIVKARAEFSKSLPFEIKLESFTDKLIFDGQKVGSFGISEFGAFEMRELVKIIYYKNDNNFIVKLLPKDKKHEIVLFKTEKSFNSIAEMVKEIDKLTLIGENERKNEKVSWKYNFCYNDELVIPKFSFNIETNYKTLEGIEFTANDQIHEILEAWQRTAFVLNESGAEIESEAEVSEAVEEVPEDEDLSKPKRMVFDKPFLTLLKRVDAKNSYFAMWTVNTELMVRE